jgi:hypothetical protein
MLGRAAGGLDGFTKQVRDRIASAEVAHLIRPIRALPISGP